MVRPFPFISKYFAILGHVGNHCKQQILHCICNCTYTSCFIRLPLFTTVIIDEFTVYPKKCAHGVVVLCFFVVMQSFIMNSHEVFIHIHQGCFAGIGAIVRLPQCQWSKPDGYGKISQCITTTKHSKAKTVCIFLGIKCKRAPYIRMRRWLQSCEQFNLSIQTFIIG